MSGPRVLVVEDDPSVRGLLQTVLVADGYDVATASDGVAGLRQASIQRPALVLLDLVMPDLGGVRVLEELRSDPSLADVPVVVITGRAEAVPALQALLGPDMVFVKPFVVADLLHRVTELVGGSAGPTGASPPAS